MGSRDRETETVQKFAVLDVIVGGDLTEMTLECDQQVRDKPCSLGSVSRA